MGHSEGSPEREIPSNTSLHLKKKKEEEEEETFQINNLTLNLQQLEEQQQRQPRASRRKEITKIRAQLNDIETKLSLIHI